MSLKSALINNKILEFPAFFPDATRGVIRSIDSLDLKNTGVEGIVVNTYHLSLSPGKNVLKQVQGIKELMNWRGFVISDSGGFQLLSLIHRDQNFGKINDDGVVFYHNDRKYEFTPEKSIQMQFALRADIMICFDDCPASNANEKAVKKSVERTIAWAKRCKSEFEKLLKQQTDLTYAPVLFGVIQGGSDKAMRKRCALALKEIGFDGYGFGGWPLDDDGNFDHKILAYTASLMPNDKPKYALGVGNPQAIVDCAKMGYTLFDCVLPTRDARHKRLYVFTKDPKQVNIFEESNFYEFMHIAQEKYVKDTSRVSEFCDCYTCKNFSRAYLHHLFTIEDSLAGRLATIHNLRLYTMLIDNLRTHESKQR